MSKQPTTSLTISGDEFVLHRWPHVSDDPLQAWDAADEYLLSHVAELLASGQMTHASRVLLLNDVHGALATCLHAFAPVSWSDSCVSHRAAAENLSANQVGSSLNSLPSTDNPDGCFDLILVRIPKATALLEDQLARVRSHCQVETVIIAGAMIKHLQKSAFACFERYIGPVTTSLGVKKARLLFATLDESLPASVSPYPSRFHDSDTGIELISHANVFSRDHLDHGARFLLEQLPSIRPVKRAADLGCGNGVLGIKLLEQMSEVAVTFIDESYSAIASARENCHNLLPAAAERADFVVADGLELQAPGSLDVVLCNPPFHQQHTVGEQIALSMFSDSKRCLVQGGELWIVANRHLDYARHLKRLFGNCRLFASNRKFNVLKVIKR